MEWKTLATIALGLGAGALGALVPNTALFAFPAAGYLLGIVTPQPKTWRQKPEVTPPQKTP